MRFVTKAPPINSIDSKCLTKKTQASFHVNGFYNSPGMDTHMYTYQFPGQKHAPGLIIIIINTAHNSTFLRIDKSTVSSSTFNSLMNKIQTTWRFLIKAPYLGKLSVIYDTENKGL